MVSYFYPPASGGLSAQTHFLSRSLVQLGVQVLVATVRLANAPAREVVDGVNVRRLPTLPMGGYRTRAHPWLGPLAAFILANRNSFDLIHVHQALHPAALCVALGRLLGLPVIAKVTGSGASGNVKILQQWKGSAPLVRFLLRRADCMISLSGETTSELLEDGYLRRNIVELPNGVDIDRYSILRNDKPRISGLVVTSTRLSKEKANDVLLRAWCNVLSEVPEARLLILGDGPERAALTRLSQELGVSASVTFAGQVDDVARHLAAADVFVLPSRFGEGMSNALLEALAAGCACLASDIVANREVLRDGADGLLFRSEDPVDLARQLLILLRDDVRRLNLGLAARRAACERYSMVSVVQRYTLLYQTLLAGRAPRR
jgi:glycosyltransferase involved in cell wall biosynthesis